MHPEYKTKKIGGQAGSASASRAKQVLEYYDRED
jgi:hypothetical protein